MASISIQKFEGSAFTNEILGDAVQLFSSNYGVWGSIAAEKMGVEQGKLCS
jgi:hypothetical protein